MSYFFLLLGSSSSCPQVITRTEGTKRRPSNDRGGVGREGERERERERTIERGEVKNVCVRKRETRKKERKRKWGNEREKDKSTPRLQSSKDDLGFLSDLCSGAYFSSPLTERNQCDLLLPTKLEFRSLKGIV